MKNTQAICGWSDGYAVNGGIIAEKMKVKLNANWPDFVFEKNYDLMSIEDLEKYIESNKHLPGLPKATDVNKKGEVDLGEMNQILLKKVEELTLYIVSLNKKLEEANQYYHK
jgi:hypothetical protein